jgi:hypothetical protein
MCPATADTDLIVREIVGSGFTNWISVITTGLHEMRDAGLMRPDAEPEELATFVIAALEGGAIIDKATGLRDTAETRPEKEP